MSLGDEAARRIRHSRGRKGPRPAGEGLRAPRAHASCANASTRRRLAPVRCWSGSSARPPSISTCWWHVNAIGWAAVPRRRKQALLLATTATKKHFHPGGALPSLTIKLTRSDDLRRCHERPIIAFSSRAAKTSDAFPTRQRLRGHGDRRRPLQNRFYFPRRRSTASTAVHPSGMSESICATPSRSAPSVMIGTSL